MFLRILCYCCINNSNFFIHVALVFWITCQKESTFVLYTHVSTVSQSWSVALAIVSTYCPVQHFAERNFITSHRTHSVSITQTDQLVMFRVLMPVWSKQIHCAARCRAAKHYGKWYIKLAPAFKLSRIECLLGKRTEKLYFVMGPQQINQNCTLWRLLKTGVTSRSRPRFGLCQNVFSLPVRSIARRLTASIGPTYLCEQTFSQMTIITSRYWNILKMNI